MLKNYIKNKPIGIGNEVRKMIQNTIKEGE